MAPAWGTAAAAGAADGTAIIIDGPADGAAAPSPATVVASAGAGAAPELALPKGRPPGMLATSRQARPIVVSPTASGRVTASRDVPMAASQRRQPAGRRRAASASLKMKSRGRVGTAASGMAARAGHTIGFLAFLRYGLAVTAGTLLLATVYVLLRYT